MRKLLYVDMFRIRHEVKENFSFQAKILRMLHCESLNPEEIKFSHSWIDKNYRDKGYSVDDILSEEVCKKFPPIVLCKINETVCSLNNRRLYHFRKLQRKIKVVTFENDEDISTLGQTIISEIGADPRLVHASCIAYTVDNGMVLISFKPSIVLHEIESVCLRQPLETFPIHGSVENPSLEKQEWKKCYLQSPKVYRNWEEDIKTKDLFFGKAFLTRNYAELSGNFKKNTIEHQTWIQSLKQISAEIGFHVQLYENFRVQEKTKINPKKVIAKSVSKTDDMKQKQPISKNRNNQKSMTNSKTFVQAFKMTDEMDYYRDWSISWEDETEYLCYLNISSLDDINRVSIPTIQTETDFIDLKTEPVVKISNKTFQQLMIDDLNNYEKNWKHYDDITEKRVISIKELTDSLQNM